MRVITFRAWDKCNKFMLDTEQCIDKSVFESHHEEDGDIVLMQFTGLLDKNGKEIYEGDVIQYKSYHVNKRWWSRVEDIPFIEEECKRQREEVCNCLSVVKYDNGAFRINYPVTLTDVSRGYRFHSGSSHSCDTEEKQWDFEVIGNIYENPELLAQ